MSSLDIQYITLPTGQSANEECCGLLLCAHKSKQILRLSKRSYLENVQKCKHPWIILSTSRWELETLSALDVSGDLQMLTDPVPVFAS